MWVKEADCGDSDPLADKYNFQDYIKVSRTSMITLRCSAMASSAARGSCRMMASKITWCSVTKASQRLPSQILLSTITFIRSGTRMISRDSITGFLVAAAI